MQQEDFWKQRWSALFWATLLGFVLSCNYTNHGPLIPTLVQLLGITLGAAGLFTTAVFFTHSLLQMPGGAMSDKFGAKRVGTFGLVVIAIGNILTGMASSYEQILLFKFITGIGTGSAIQAGLRYVPTFFAGKEIALAQGVYGGSILLGAGFVIYVIPRLLGLLAWQGIFFLTGTMAAILAVLWVLLAPGTPITIQPKKINWGELLGNRNVWLLALTQVGSFGTVTSCSVWINMVLQKNIHLDPKTAGMIGALVLLIGILGRPVGGLILDRKWLTAKQLLCLSHVGLAVGFIW
nr:MFS transporter [Sporomusaceae bacterium]